MRRLSWPVLLLLGGCASQQAMVLVPTLAYAPDVETNHFDQLEGSLVARCYAAPYETGAAKPGCASNTYLQAAYYFQQVGDLGGASRAYWAAAVALNDTPGSRSQREETLASIFHGLADLAKQRKQDRWEHVLRLAARLSSTYVASDEGKEEARQFKQAQRRLEQAAAEASEAASNAKFMNSLQGFSLQAGMNFGTVNLSSGLSQMGGLLMSNRSIDRTLQAELESIGSTKQQIIEAADEGSLDVEGQSRFLAERATFYLQSARDPKPYLVMLADVAVPFGFTELERVAPALAQKGSFTRDELVLLANALAAEERQALLKSRSWSPYTPPSPDAPIRFAKAQARLTALYAAKAEKAKALEAARVCSAGNCSTLAGCQLGDWQDCHHFAVNLLYVEKRPEAAQPYLENACQAGIQASCDLVKQAKEARQVASLKASNACSNDVECPWLAKCQNGDSAGCNVYLSLLSARKAPELGALAERWCAEGVAEACSQLSQWLKDGKQPSVPKDETRAATVRLRACELGAAVACMLVGYEVVRGAGAHDWAASRRFHERACALNATLCGEKATFDAWDTYAALRNGAVVRPPSGCVEPVCGLEVRCGAGDAAACAEASAALVPEGAKLDGALRKVLLDAHQRHCGWGLAPECERAGFQAMQMGSETQVMEGIPWFEKGCALGYAHACTLKEDQLARIPALERLKKGDCPNEYGCAAAIKCEAGDLPACDVVVYALPTPEARLERAAALCEQKKSSACRLAGNLASGKVPGVFDQVAALPFKEKACELADKDACAEVGSTYLYGTNGVNKDVAKAKHFLEAACRLKVDYTCNILSQTDWSTGGWVR